LEPGVSQAIKSLLANKGIRHPIRIDVRSSGCCDALLCMCVDRITKADLSLELDGLTFVINRATYELVGDVTVFYADEPGRSGFVLTSSKPLGEWDGFGVSEIKF
jgi:Fe-S cluster assembly iron-binding protein IscA